MSSHLSWWLVTWLVIHPENYPENYTKPWKRGFLLEIIISGVYLFCHIDVCSHLSSIAIRLLERVREGFTVKWRKCCINRFGGQGKPWSLVFCVVRPEICLSGDRQASKTGLQGSGKLNPTFRPTSQVLNLILGFSGETQKDPWGTCFL